MATRRSARIAASSRASSVDGDSNVAVPPPPKVENVKARSTRKVTKPRPFNMAGAITQLAQLGRAYLQERTNEEKDALVLELHRRLTTSEKERGVVEAEFESFRLSNRRMRHALFAEKIAKVRYEGEKEEAAKAQAAAAAAAEAACAAPSPSLPRNEPLQSSPDADRGAAATTSTTDGVIETLVPAEAGLFRRVMRTITSPFGYFAAAPPPPPPSAEVGATSAATLGELPTSRKRPAPASVSPSQEEESEMPETTTPRSKRAKTHHFFTAPSSKRPGMPSSLGTISEYTEPSEHSIMAPDPTPSKMPATTPRRTIASVRKAQLDKLANMGSVGRQPTWSSTPRPRDPNADRRLEKLARWNQVNAEYQQLKNDSDIREMQLVPTMRVNVDHLKALPHRRPTDPAGTFRAPDIDSDDEMEVEEDVSLVDNVFSASQSEDDEHMEEVIEATPTPKPAVQAKVPSQPTAVQPPIAPAAPLVAQSEQEPDLAAMAPLVAQNKQEPGLAAMAKRAKDKYQLPCVGLRRPDQVYTPEYEIACGVKFKLVHEHYQRTGQIIAFGPEYNDDYEL